MNDESVNQRGENSFTDAIYSEGEDWVVQGKMVPPGRLQLSHIYNIKYVQRADQLLCLLHC